MLLTMTNQSRNLKGGNEYRIIFNTIGATRNFRIFCTYLSKIQQVMILA